MKTPNDVTFHGPRYSGDPVSIQHQAVPNACASYAMDLAKHFALVAGIPDGEDTSGRQRLRLATPAEVASRACQVAEILFQQMGDRGWYHQVPTHLGKDDQMDSPELLDRISDPGTAGT